MTPVVVLLFRGMVGGGVTCARDNKRGGQLCSGPLSTHRTHPHLAPACRTPCLPSFYVPHLSLQHHSTCLVKCNRVL